MTTKTATLPSHLWLDERGRAWIDDRNLKVTEVIEALMANGWSVNQYLEDHDNYLTAGQVHAALSYYYDHQQEIDAEIERWNKEVARLRAESHKSPQHQFLLTKLREQEEHS
jgi:uncharacterized protein (DUF433 family)